MIATNPVPDRGVRGTAALVLACISLIMALIALSVAALGDASDSGVADDRLPSVQSKPEVASASQLEAVAHVVLPPGTVLLSAAYSNGLETRLSAKFRMPRSELNNFVKSAKFTAALKSGLRAVDAKDNVGGGDLWDPGTATAVSGFEEEEPTADGTRRAVMLSFDTTNVVTVYLYAGRN